MRLQQLTAAAFVSTAIILIPMVSVAAMPRECVAGKPTAASSTWNFRQEADNIFTAIERDAWQADYHAEQFASLVSRPDTVSLESDANELDRLQAAVDDANQRLCRLEAIRSAVEPWQQRAIDRIAKSVTLMTHDTRQAMVTGVANRETMWVPSYQRSANTLYSEARNLARYAQGAVAHAKTEAAS